MASIAELIAPVKSAPGLHYKNPRFPLNIKLPNKLEAGTKIFIHGASFVTAQRFAFNLRDAEKDANNFFHFNPRFDEECVVRNSRLDESWGDEERDGPQPFEPGKPFLITITPSDDNYEVGVNGSHFITYNHRDGMPYKEVSHLSMWGDIVIYGIHIPQLTMTSPIDLRIPKNSFLGDSFLIEGEVPDGADRFHVNIQCGEQEDADILYHFNPRFGHNALVCNNRCHDAWGDEERLEGLPVAPGEKFTLSIVAAKEGYIPTLNGNPMPVFQHRLDLCGGCTLSIGGDVKVDNVRIDCAPVRMPPTVPDIDSDTFEETTTQALQAHAPVMMTLLGNCAPGKVVYFSGRVDDVPGRFALNLLCGDGEDDDIALHINPRWDDDEGSVLVINSREGGAWGDEVRLPNPINPGEEVDMFVIGTDDGISILVNGESITEVPHRMDIGRITNVSLNGSVTLHRLMANC